MSQQWEFRQLIEAVEGMYMYIVRVFTTDIYSYLFIYLFIGTYTFKTVAPVYPTVRSQQY